jgi:hypothetical protein
MRNNKRKIVLGIAALTVPLVTVASLGTPALAAKAPPNPVSCGLAATVNINPALSVAGELSSKGQFGVAAVSVTLNGCHDAAGAVGNMTVPINVEFPAAKPKNDSAAINAGDNPKDYYLGLCGAFASSATVKDLKKAVKNLPFAGGELKGPKASEGTVGTDVGFNLSGTIKGGTYPTAKNGATIGAGLTNDANNTNLIGGCQGGPVSSIDIDSSQSSATL